MELVSDLTLTCRNACVWPRKITALSISRAIERSATTPIISASSFRVEPVALFGAGVVVIYAGSLRTLSMYATVFSRCLLEWSLWHYLGLVL